MSNRAHQGERGTVLLVVILLVIMFTGLGLLAMRHTRLELRSTGAYLDSAQAGKLAEGGVALVATDLRLSSDYYQFMFTSSDSESETTDAGTDEVQYTIPLSTMFQEGDAGSSEDGTISYLSGTLATNTEQAALYGVEADTKVTQSTPVLAPCPPGYSCIDDQNYGWYYFTMNSTAVYGPPASLDGSHPLYERGRARARGRVTVGPIAAYGQ
jgi:Tfp pilus assembly protein PilX